MMQDTDSLSRYLDDIRDYPRINPEREVELSKMILEGADAETVEKAVDELIVANLRLVVHCAKDFLHYTNQSDTCITVMDLVSEGNIGLMSAARGFNAHFGSGNARLGGGRSVKFSTYACKCIKRRMLRAIRLAKFIHIPEHHFTCRKRLAELEDEVDGACESEICEELGITRNKLQMVREGQDSATCRLEDLRVPDGEACWSDLIENPASPRPDLEVQQRDLRRMILAEVRRLPTRTRRIISKVFLSRRPLTFRELAGEFGISKERCRQVCVQGLNMLKRRLEPRFGRAIGVGLVFREEMSSSFDGGTEEEVVLVANDYGTSSLVLWPQQDLGSQEMESTSLTVA